jgi:hypothetical protein
VRDAVVLAATSFFLWAGAACAGHAPSSREAHPLTQCVHGQCAEGYACHYEHAHDAGAAQIPICRPDVGRCNGSTDCAPNQLCVRHTARLGVCSRRDSW